MRQGSCYRFLPFFYISGFWVLDWTPPLPLPPFGDESLPYHHTCYIVTSIFSCLITRQLKLKICEGRFGKGQCGLAWPMMSPSWSSNRELVHLSVATPVKNTRLSPDRRKSEHWHQHRWQTGRYHHQYMATYTKRQVAPYPQSVFPPSCDPKHHNWFLAKEDFSNFSKHNCFWSEYEARLIVLNMSLFTDVVLHSGD